MITDTIGEKGSPVKYNLEDIQFNPYSKGILDAFVWGKTPEGHNYWSRLYNGVLSDEDVQEAYAKLDAMKKQWFEENTVEDLGLVKDESNEILVTTTGCEDVGTTYLSVPAKSDGGPSSYYDFKDTYHTLNDWMEDKAKEQWGAYSLHMKDLIKGATRFGTKSGVGVDYDINKMLYSSIRMKVMEVGKQKAVEYILSILEDKQFK